MDCLFGLEKLVSALVWRRAVLIWVGGLDRLEMPGGDMRISRAIGMLALWPTPELCVLFCAFPIL